jgi:hypothetical protein
MVNPQGPGVNQIVKKWLTEGGLGGSSLREVLGGGPLLSGGFPDFPGGVEVETGNAESDDDVRPSGGPEPAPAGVMRMIFIDPATFPAWCRENGFELTSRARQHCAGVMVRHLAVARAH